MERNKIIEKLKEHRDLILVTLFFVFGSLGLIWVANVETDAKQLVDSAHLKISKARCEKIANLIADGNLSKGVPVQLDDLTAARAGCATYLKYLETSEDNIPNVASETNKTEQTLVHIDKALSGSDEYKKSAAQ